MQASNGSNAEHRPGAESPDAFTITDLARWNIHCLQDCYLLPTRINVTLNRMDIYKQLEKIEKESRAWGVYPEWKQAFRLTEKKMPVIDAAYEALSIALCSRTEAPEVHPSDDFFVDDDPTQVISIAELPDLEFNGKKRRDFLDALRSFFGSRPLELLQ